jgi:hypothetical protein
MRLRILSRLFYFSTLFLFFLMFVFPMVLELLYVKTILFALILLICLIDIIKHGYLPLHKTILQLTILMLFVGAIFFCEGWIRNTPGAFKQAQVYILWPLIYIILLTSLKEQKLLIGLERTIVISTIVLSIYGIVHVLANLSILPEFFSRSPFKSETIGFGYRKGFMEMTLPGINSLPFLVPFCITALFYWVPEKEHFPVKRSLIWIAILSGLVFSFITARKAVWLVILISPIVALTLSYISDPKLRIRRKINKKRFYYFVFILLPVLVFVYIFITSIYDFNLNSILKEFFSGFRISSRNEVARYHQFSALVKGWLEHPLFGSGLGATAAKYGSVRSPSSPWSYELFYLALLFQVGLVGMIIYSSGVIWTYFQGIKIIKSSVVNKRIIMPFLVGMTCMFVAGGTNPVFIRFDALWFFFIPIAIINNWMLNRKKEDNEYVAIEVNNQLK